eukprot:TRINITY_DN14680_c0_g1_i1.p1 TRINITY_DN14680_c0_g1~~TRINITY_DN14680_c0_g1_i1.p1  ORF type:complete len:336 (+),score=99.64 TRINITY_DN14680_c0_g1_i1:201-1208(+)
MDHLVSSVDKITELFRGASPLQLAAAAAASVFGALVLRRTCRPALRAVQAGESVLVTGAGTGIGAACATYLVDVAGFRVYAGVLSEAEGVALRAQVKRPELLVPLVLDITKPDHIEAAVNAITAASGGRGLYGMLNNAGIASLQGAVERTDVDIFRRVMEVNFFGTVAVTKAFLPLIKQARGRILILTSMSGRYSAPFIAPYSSSKYALEAFIDALRRETCYLGIKVIGIQPAIIKTEIVARDAKFVEGVKEDPEYHQYRSWLRNFHNQILTDGQPPVVIAKEVDQALRSANPKVRYSAGGLLGFMTLLGRLPDTWADWVQHMGYSMLPRDVKLL